MDTMTICFYPWDSSLAANTAQLVCLQKALRLSRAGKLSHGWNCKFVDGWSARAERGGVAVYSKLGQNTHFYESPDDLNELLDACKARDAIRSKVGGAHDRLEKAQAARDAADVRRHHAKIQYQDMLENGTPALVRATEKVAAMLTLVESAPAAELEAARNRYTKARIAREKSENVAHNKTAVALDKLRKFEAQTEKAQNKLDNAAAEHNKIVDAELVLVGAELKDFPALARSLVKSKGDTLSESDKLRAFLANPEVSEESAV